MSRELVIGVACGLIAGAWLSLATSPTTAIAQSSAGTTGLYQIQIASGMAQAGTSPIWRVNTATGALDFCTFTNVTCPVVVASPVRGVLAQNSAEDHPMEQQHRSSIL